MLGGYPFEIEGFKSILNVLDNGTRPNEIINELGLEKKLGRTEQERTWNGFTILETKDAVCLTKF